MKPRSAVMALYLVFMLGTHREQFASDTETGPEAHQTTPEWGLPRALATLIGASALAAWMKRYSCGMPLRVALYLPIRVTKTG